MVQLALPGMNTVDEASQLHEEGLAYDPDLVVVGYVLNDSEDSEAAEARRARDWAEEKREKREPRLLDHSALFRWWARGSSPPSRTAGASRAIARCTAPTPRAGWRGRRP